MAQEDLDKKNLKVMERLLGSRVNRLDSSTREVLARLNDPTQRREALLSIADQEAFYKITVKNFASRMSVRSEEVSAPLNDFSATIIGVARDNRDARELLTGDYIYMADTSRIPVRTPGEEAISIPSDFFRNIVLNNSHYQAIENNLYQLNLKDILIPVPQRVQSDNSIQTGNLVNNPDPAGLLTSNTWGREHLIMGTNRRAVEYALKSFLCTPMEEAADTQASDARIGRDIDRFPGGDHSRFLTSCKGCHTVMDGFRGAFAQWNYNGFLIHGSLHRNRREMDANGIAVKMNRNAEEFPSGYVTQDSSWVNNATRGKNVSHFSWSNTVPNSGTGAGSFGRLLANSDRFAQCMARRAFVEVCQRSQSVFKDVNTPVVLELAKTFKSSGYKLKELFIAAATHQKCE
jgi:hypothetical protein